MEMTTVQFVNTLLNSVQVVLLLVLTVAEIRLRRAKKDAKDTYGW